MEKTVCAIQRLHQRRELSAKLTEGVGERERVLARFTLDTSVRQTPGEGFVVRAAAAGEQKYKKYDLKTIRKKLNSIGRLNAEAPEVPWITVIFLGQDFTCQLSPKSP